MDFLSITVNYQLTQIKLQLSAEANHIYIYPPVYNQIWFRSSPKPVTTAVNPEAKRMVQRFTAI